MDIVTLDDALQTPVEKIARLTHVSRNESSLRTIPAETEG